MQETLDIVDGQNYINGRLSLPFFQVSTKPPSSLFANVVFSAPYEIEKIYQLERNEALFVFDNNGDTDNENVPIIKLTLSGNVNTDSENLRKAYLAHEEHVNGDPKGIAFLFIPPQP